MSGKSLFGKISSKYIIEFIFSYSKDENIIFKLIMYSKVLQKKFSINIIDYQKKYYDNAINYESYLKTYEGKNVNLDYDINRKLIEERAIQYFKNYLKNNKDFDIYKSPIDINIESPLFDALSKSDIFDKIFNILIPIDLIKELSIKERYITCFENLNKSNVNYSSLEINLKARDVMLLYDFHINFSIVKRITINLGNNDFNFNFFFQTFFSYTPIITNLIFLEINLYKINKINANLLDTINELKSLQYLYLGEIQFSPFFILKLNNLKGMSFTKCSNISFLDENIFLNLNSLNFTGAKLIKINQLLKCPNLEIIHLYNKFETFKYINPEEFYHTIINFKSFQKLRQFNGAQKYLMLIDSNCPIESINLDEEDSNAYTSFKKEKKYIDKILSFKNLKNINLRWYGSYISEIRGENYSVIKLEIISESSGNLINLEKIFPNLLELKVKTNRKAGKNYELKIQENENSKINSLELNIINEHDLTLICGPYNKLEKVDFSIYKLIDLKSFPILNDICNASFDSLNTFIFRAYTSEINNDLLINIFNNINHAPNLKYFYLYFKCKDNIKKEDLRKYLKKILDLKSIQKIDININFKNEKSSLNINSKTKLKNFIKENN